MALPIPPRFTVFISHAGEDKATIAIPLRERLRSLYGITAFVDEPDMPPGTPAEEAMISAMNTAEIVVIVLSPEFVARKWPMKELMTFLERRDKGRLNSPGIPVIIPFFYRLRLSELREEPRFDRLDENGDSIYRLSEFLQRMERGDPEANIAKVKAALLRLRGFMGIRNDLGASNDSSFPMTGLRDILLNNLCEAVARVVAKEIEHTSKARAKRKRKDVFHPHFDATDTSKLVLDFAPDVDGIAHTQEARLLQIILDSSATVCRTVAIQGMAGVGKTSMLLGLSTQEAAVRLFRDGIYHVSLRMNGTQSLLIEELSMAVENSGGREKANEMREEKDFRAVIKCLRSWFAGRHCLFIFDNIFETADIGSTTIHLLLRLQECGQGCKSLIATRNVAIAAMADVVIRLEARKAFDLQAREILTRYSGLAPDERNLAEVRAILAILRRCSGLPLFLAVAGKGIRALSLLRRAKPRQAYQVYASRLDADMQSLVNTAVDSYEMLKTTLLVSMKLLEERMNNLEFNVSLTAAEMYRRLSVIEKREMVPMSMLQHLWEVPGAAEAAIVAREFEQIALADIEMSEDDSGHKEMLRLHDSLHLFAVAETRRCGEQKVGHKAVLDGYGEGLESTEGYRTWWSMSLKPDNYIHKNLCRHLLQSGRHREIVELLLRPEWTARSFAISGLLQVERDFGLCLSTLCTRHRQLRNVPSMTMNETETEFQVEDDTAKSMELISVALGSASVVIKNLSELWFQVHGRLKAYSRRFQQIGEYLDRMEENPTRPSIRSINCFLEEPSLANVRIISVGVRIRCMVPLGDGQRVACGCEDGRIVVLDVMQSKIEYEFEAHTDRVQTLALARNGTRLVSGSSDTEAKVWEIDSYRCLKTFKGYKHFATCVSVMTDGIRVVSVCQDGALQVWNMDTAQLPSRSIRNEEGSVMCVAALPDGEHIVTGGKDGMLRLWNLSTGAQVGREFTGHDSWVNCVCVSPDGSQIVSGSIDGTVRTWDIDKHEQVGNSFDVSNEGISSVDYVAFSESSEKVVSASSEGLIVWDMVREKRVWQSFGRHSMEITGVLFLNGIESVVSCSSSGDVRVWDVSQEAFKSESHRHKHQAPVKCVCFTPNGRRVVTGSRDMTLRIWDVESGLQLGSPLRGHCNWVRGVAVTPDEQWIVSVSDDDAKLCFWSMASRELVHKFSGHTSWICDVAITPKGDRAITGSWDETVRVWDLQRMDGSHRVLHGHNNAVWTVSTSDDGSHIISVEEHKIFVWELETGQCVKSLIRREAWKLSRKEILNLVGEDTVHDTTQLSIPVQGSVIQYGEGRRRRVIATLPERVWSWDLSRDMKTVCVGLEDGTVAFLSLEA